MASKDLLSSNSEELRGGSGEPEIENSFSEFQRFLYRNYRVNCQNIYLSRLAHSLKKSCDVFRRRQFFGLTQRA